jgi:hypothetical protein
MPVPIVLPPHPFRGRKKHSPDELKKDISRAAASLDSGTFQYVSTSFLSQVTQYLTNVTGTAIDPITGKVFMLRRTQPAIVILNADGFLARTRSDTEIVQGHSIEVFVSNNGPASLWVTDVGGTCIRTFDTEGKALTVVGPEIQGTTTIDSEDGSIGVPEAHGPVMLGKVCALTTSLYDSTAEPWKITDVAFDTTLGRIYVTDGDVGGPNNRVLVLNRSCECIAVWGSPSLQAQTSSSNAQFNLPHALLVDGILRVWVVDSLNSRVVVFDSTGNYLALWFSTRLATTSRRSLFQARNSMASHFPQPAQPIRIRESSISRDNPFLIPLRALCLCIKSPWMP